jgi:hypothetical protein
VREVLGDLGFAVGDFDPRIHDARGCWHSKGMESCNPFEQQGQNASTPEIARGIQSNPIQCV